MSKFHYQGNSFDLTRETDRKSLSKLGPFTQSVSSLAEQWYSDISTFKFKTSGSTGTQKDIVHSRDKLKKSATQTIERFGLTSNDRALLVLDPTRIAGAMMLIRAAEKNMDITGVEPGTNLMSNKTLISSCTFTALVPLQLEQIINADPTAKVLESYRTILAGGAPVTYSQLIKFQQITSPVFETFGMTETVSHFAVRALNGIDKAPHFTVLGDHEVSQDDRGCLVVKGLLTDYRPLNTNDIVEVRDAKHFSWIGRYDHIINSGGIKFLPEKIESEIDPLFHAFGLDARFIIIGMPDDTLGSRIVLVIEGDPISANIQEELMHSIKEKLEKYSAPKQILYLHTFPETLNGKVVRKEVMKILTGQPLP